MEKISLLTLAQEAGVGRLPDLMVPVALMFLIAYLIGSIPFSYVIVRALTGEDITEHGTGNVGAMNVRRTTGSWSWFIVAMLADALKGFLPTLAAVVVPAMLVDPSLPIGGAAMSGSAAAAVGAAVIGPRAVVIGAVVGHNYSFWLSLSKRRILGGKGLATGGGALLAYDWRYFLIAVGVGLLVIGLTRYMMAGQVTAAVALPLYALVTGQPDVAFVVLLGALVYARHHRRFLGLLRGEEPKLYVEDRMGPKG